MRTMNREPNEEAAGASIGTSTGARSEEWPLNATGPDTSGQHETAPLAGSDLPPGAELQDAGPAHGGAPAVATSDFARFLAADPTGRREGEGDRGGIRRKSRRAVNVPDEASGSPAIALADPTRSPPEAPPWDQPLGIGAAVRPGEASLHQEASGTPTSALRVPRPSSKPAPPLPAADPLPQSGAPSPETYEVIRPTRIINIGSQPPPANVPVAKFAPEAPRGETEVSFVSQTALPDTHAADTAAALKPAPLPKIATEALPLEPGPPEVARTDGEAAGGRTDEIEPIPDEEIERISDLGAANGVPATQPKKRPPPPPRRPTSIEPPSQPLSAPARPNAAPPPPAVAPPAPVQTLDLGRKRQKPWWEEIFGDDFMRTMDRTEGKAIAKECNFIEERLGLEKGAVILDLACGAGEHAVELACRGYNVVGYDLSLAMLARAQDEALDRGQQLNFLQGDMREMAFDGAFDGMYCWATSFGYFDDEKNLDVLMRIHRGLRQGGMLLLDVVNHDYVAPRQPNLVWFEGDGCVCMDEMFVDFFASRLRVKRTVMFEDGRARECDYSIRLYALHELGKMLHDCGFRVVEVTGHPAHPGVFFGSESPRIIVLAERS